MGSNVSTQRSQEDTCQPWSCSLCRGLRPRGWPANSTRSFVGEDIDLYWFPKDIALVRDPNQTCSFCCFIRSVIDHLCREGNHEWPTTVPIRGKTISNSSGKFSGYYSLYIELRPEYPLRNRDIDIFLDDPKKKLPWLEIKHLPPCPLRDPGSAAALEWTKARLKKCQKSHKMCKPPKGRKLPKRVVDIGQYPAVRLLETSGQEKEEYYACISHRWGEEGQVLATNTQTLATRLEDGIQWDQIPKVLQEAITLVHQLGIRYLWVASLCILQDNQDDQVAHSSQIGTIFSNAHITIAAARADNASQSLFSSGESTLTYNDIPLILRERPYHPNTYNSNFYTFPLLCRAWAAQDILLSRRVLYVCEGILTYECVEKGSGWSCTCTSDLRNNHSSPGLKDPSMGVSLFAKPPPNYPFRPWWDVIMYYTKRDIPDERDRLPALSNIARHFAEQQHRGGPITYAAGLWVEDMPEGLLWHHRHNHSPKPRNSASTAPSWSWASTVGRSFPHAVDPSCDLFYVSVASVECLPLSSSAHEPDGYGLLQSGKLVLTGSCLLPFDLWHRPGTRHYKAVHAGKGGINVLPEIEIEYRDDGWDAGKKGEYYGLPMARISSDIRDLEGSSLGYTVLGLVLRRLNRDGQGNEFERVAFWEATSEKGYWGKEENEWSGERLDRLLEGKQGETVVIW